jgi:ABC-type branched-subunit amino acid transport system substrate-binding protein
MEKLKRKRIVLVLLSMLLVLGFTTVSFADVVKIGINYPKTGPYWIQGLDQIRAAKMAVEEINAAGGILGNEIRLVERNSRSQAPLSTANATELIDEEGVKMIFGGSSSGVAIAVGKVCQAKGIPFFGTLTYSTATTGTEGKRMVFRECYDAWMAAKAIAAYLKDNYPANKNKYFYVTADYSWGHTTEASVRTITGSTDEKVHKGVRTPFPGAKYTDFFNALMAAREFKPDVLVVVEFGKDMEIAVKMASKWGMKETAQIVVPNITLGMAEGAGPANMEGVIAASPWNWRIPYQYNYPKGKAFVEKFTERYKRYPSTSGASAYTILYEYKAAVERAGTFKSSAVVRALEGHSYELLKDRQTWRDFDHQSVQTVYAVRGKKRDQVTADKYQLDYFEILSSISGAQAAITRAEWNAARQKAGKPTSLERLPD